MSTAPSAPAHVARTHFQDELRELEERTIGGLNIVLEQLDRSLEAVAHQDIELASMVINDDDRIDGRYLEVHQTVLSLLARQTPVAGDLRVVAALLHVIRNVERMGDQCVNMCKVLPLTGNDAPTQPEILAKVARMGEVVRSEVSQARRAFADRDVAVAEDLLRQDQEVNQLQRDIFQLAVASGDEIDRREWAMCMTLVARALERIGDNAVDVGEQTVFVVTGLFKEFASRKP
jgi:phosphate transport system protein